MNEITATKQGGLSLIDKSLYQSFIAYLDVKPKSIITYETAIRQFAKWITENGITQPTREDIICYRDFLLKDHKPATVQNYLVAVKLFFAWLEQEGLYKDVAQHVKGVKLDREHKKDYLTQHQSRRVLACVDASTLTGKRDLALLGLLLTTGMRTIEAQRANIGDMETVGGCTALFIQGKGHNEKAQYVKIAEEVEDLITDYLKSRGASRRTAADRDKPLFASGSNHNQGGRMTTRSISRIVKNSFIKAGYESDRLTAHSTRHTAATLNLLNGGTLEETQQLLRHKNISTTTIYTHALERANNESERRIAKGLFG